MMFNYYLKTAIRSFYRNKATTFINILGLSIAFCLFILLMLYVNNELTTDKYHTKLDRIFRIIESNGVTNTTSSTLASYVKANYPEVAQSCRTLSISGKILYDEKSFNFNQMCLADSNHFSVFDYELIKGDLNRALEGENGLVITETFAKQLFGDEDPLNKIVQLGENSYWLREGYSLVVKAVIKDVPQNSSLIVDGFISLSMLEKTAAYMMNNENVLNFTTWILLNQSDATKNVLELLDLELKNRYHGWNRTALQPLDELFFNQTRDDFRHGNIQLVNLFCALAFFIVFMACINYVNLANAQAILRAKEVGMRKIMGAPKGRLIIQFLSESIFLILLCLIIGFLLAEFMIDNFNLLAKTNFKVKTFYQFNYLLIVIPGALMIGMLSGLYPTLVLLKFRPIDVIKSRWIQNIGGLNVRRILLIVQFVISLMMIFGTIMIYRQMQFVKHMNLGFDKEKIIYLQTRDKLTKKDHPFRTKIQSMPGVKMLAVCNGIPGNVQNGMFTDLADQKIEMRHLKIDQNYLELMNIKLVLGEGFTRDSTDMLKTFMMNQSAVKKYGWDDPLSVKIWGLKCVGVVEDFNFKSAHQPIEPLFFTYEEWMKELCVKYESDHLAKLLESIEQSWIDNFPNRPFEYRFVDDVFDNLYKSEDRLAKIVSYFAVISLLIAGLGLLGLTSFIVNQRIREIGIRKILGSSSSQIIKMINVDFIKWLLIAFIIFIPLGWLIATEWLQNFSYRTNISWWVFAISGLVLFLVTIIAIRIQAYCAANMNPVDSLRYE